MALLAVFLSTVTAQVRPREPSLENLEVEHLIDQASRVFEQHGLPIEEMSVGFQYRCLRASGGKQNVVWQDYLQPASQELHLDCTGKSPARDLVFQRLLLPLERFHFPVGFQQFTG